MSARPYRSERHAALDAVYPAAQIKRSDPPSGFAWTLNDFLVALIGVAFVAALFADVI